MLAGTPTASCSITLRFLTPKEPGSLAGVVAQVERAGGVLGAIDAVGASGDPSARDMTISAIDEAHGRAIVAGIEKMVDVEVIDVSDRTFDRHLGGKIEIAPKIPIETPDDLSMAYTPGVARVCKKIAQDPGSSFDLTLRGNTVAVVTDGSAVLGLGDIGPEAALPVMEGKAALFKVFGGVDAFPICLALTEPEDIVEAVVAVSPTFGGINLEDISAPRCFEIEAKLRERLSIPVFHDDQHGTAVVVMAALINSLKLVDKSVEDLKIVVNGVGAAGVACTKILLAGGVRNIVGLDSRGVIHRNRRDLSAVKRWYAEVTNPEGVSGGLEQALVGTDLFLGLSSGGMVKEELIDSMARNPIVFAMANPIPEVMPEVMKDRVAIMATGRGDYPNQINNVLCFPGIFKGALSCRARDINEDMKLAAAEAIASVIPDDEIRSDYIIPSVFDRRVAAAIAQAVVEAAAKTGVARRLADPSAHGAEGQETSALGELV